MARLNPAELIAIDMHTHAETSTRVLPDEAEREMSEARGRYFRYQAKHPTIAQMADYYRARRMAFVVFSVDAERGMGYRGVSNEEVAESAAAEADVAIPFASVDPNRD
jgi:predicted TIM-barrel fold metal-dependent hydrolase